MTPDNFISIICHDLRAPLRGLKTLPTWAREEVVNFAGDVPPRLGEVLDMMEQQASRLDYIMSDLSAFSKLARTQPSPESRPEDALPHDEISRHFEIDIAAPIIPMELCHVQAVLSAFMDNALKHGNGLMRPAQLKVVANDEAIEITVRDFGPGFDPKFREVVFEPLRLLQSRDATEGSGMGLATVARIAELYGGSCEMRTGNGLDGAEAIFRCPMAWNA